MKQFIIKAGLVVILGIALGLGTVIMADADAAPASAPSAVVTQ